MSLEELRLPPPSQFVRVFARREPKTLNVLQVVVGGKGLDDYPVQSMLFLPDRMSPQGFSDVFVAHFETACATLRALGLSIRRMEEESVPVVESLVKETLARFRESVAGPDGRVVLATLDGRPGVLPLDRVAPSSKIIVPEGAREEVTDSATPPAPPVAPAEPAPRGIEGLSLS